MNRHFVEREKIISLHFLFSQIFRWFDRSCLFLIEIFNCENMRKRDLTRFWHHFELHYTALNLEKVIHSESFKLWTYVCGDIRFMIIIMLTVGTYFNYSEDGPKSCLQSEEFRLKFCRESVTLRRFWLCLFPRQDFKWNSWLLMLFHMILD